MSLAFLCRYRALVDEIERGFAVTDWKSGDVDIWPLARLDLYLDMYWQETGGAPPRARPFVLRAAGRIARPAINLWKSRGDLAHHVWRPKPADAIFLGDGVSLDCMDGIWQDRFGEPLMAALGKRGRTSFLMQNGDLSRLPWRRPTFPANVIEARGWLTAFPRPAILPDHARVLEFLGRSGVCAPSLESGALARRAAVVFSTASAFEGVLKTVRPKLAFVVTYFANLGPAFVLACRRQGILSIDLQRCPREGAPMAYGWSALPPRGYTTLPAMFWTWTEKDAASACNFSGPHGLPWHRSIPGGHTQMVSFDGQAAIAKFKTLAGGAVFEREILVALQPIGGRHADWDMLAAQIESAPESWRWWIRRHPASRPEQDAAFGRLLRLRKPNVMIAQASSIPLPALLPHMAVLVSLASGAAVEAAMLGVPAFFLSAEAAGPFAELIATRSAQVIATKDLNAAIAALPMARPQPSPPAAPELDATLKRLEAMAPAYAALCASRGDR